MLRPFRRFPVQCAVTYDAEPFLKLPLLDFTVIAGKSKKAYIAAIQAGLDKRYAPRERLFGEIIEQSRASS